MTPQRRRRLIESSSDSASASTSGSNSRNSSSSNSSSSNDGSSSDNRSYMNYSNLNSVNNNRKTNISNPVGQIQLSTEKKNLRRSGKRSKILVYPDSDPEENLPLELEIKSSGQSSTEKKPRDSIAKNKSKNRVVKPSPSSLNVRFRVVDHAKQQKSSVLTTPPNLQPTSTTPETRNSLQTVKSSSSSSVIPSTPTKSTFTLSNFSSRPRFIANEVTESIPHPFWSPSPAKNHITSIISPKSLSSTLHAALQHIEQDAELARTNNIFGMHQGNQNQPEKTTENKKQTIKDSKRWNRYVSKVTLNDKSAIVVDPTGGDMIVGASITLEKKLVVLGQEEVYVGWKKA